MRPDSTDSFFVPDGTALRKEGMNMILNALEQKTALDYIIYMMMGSYFKKVTFSSKWREKTMEHFYLLLGNRLQIELEETTEQCFRKTIRPSLPERFLDHEAKAFWVPRGDGKQTAIVFANAYGQLWVVTRYGGRQKRPEFYHFFLENGRNSRGRVEDLWKKLDKKDKGRKRRARAKRPA